jgi:hypothetical protein
MTVDRRQRDAVAESLAEYMRGQIGVRDLYARCEKIRELDVASPDGDKYLETFINWELNLSPYRPVTSAQWDLMRRQLAFLCTDRDETHLRRYREPSFDDIDLPRQIRMARQHLIGLKGIASVAYIGGWWWLFPAATALSFAVCQRQTQCASARHDAECKAVRQEFQACYPFATEADWLDHEILLNRLRIPTYDADLQSRVERRPLRDTVVMALGACAGGAILALCLVAAFAAEIVIWPLWLLLMSCSWHTPEEKERQVFDTPAASDC